MRTFLNERPEIDSRLFEKDRYTFSVLAMILDGPCKKTITDERTFVLCHSGEPYPVWVWTADGILEEELAEVFRITLAEWPKESHHYNIKYRAAEYFMQQDPDLSIYMNMMTYECPEPKKSPDHASGSARPCVEEDVDRMMDWLIAFQIETGVDSRPPKREELLDKARERSMFFWIDEEDIPVCMCGFRRTEDGFGRIGPVYTPPEARRKHYAESLVYTVTMKVKDLGLVPILYTNADYAASNACYQKVGYELRGTLCTVGRRIE